MARSVDVNTAQRMVRMVWACLPMDVDVRLIDAGPEVRINVQQRGEQAFVHTVQAEVLRVAVKNKQIENLADVIAAQIKTRVKR